LLDELADLGKALPCKHQYKAEYRCPENPVGEDLHGFDMLELLPVKGEESPHSIGGEGRQSSSGLE